MVSPWVADAMQEESDGLDRKAKQLVLDSDFASMIEVRECRIRERRHGR